jgi:hypothetical protein
VLQDLRKCCGGNGYLLASGIGALEGDYKWQTTAEGDFVILMLQTARFLIKSLDSVSVQRLCQSIEQIVTEIILIFFLNIFYFIFFIFRRSKASPCLVCASTLPLSRTPSSLWITQVSLLSRHAMIS